MSPRLNIRYIPFANDSISGPLWVMPRELDDLYFAYDFIDTNKLTLDNIQNASIFY